MPDERETISIEKAYRARLWKVPGLVLTFDHFSRLITVEEDRMNIVFPPSVIRAIAPVDGQFQLLLHRPSGKAKQSGLLSGDVVLHMTETRPTLLREIYEWRIWDAQEFRRGGAEAF